MQMSSKEFINCCWVRDEEGLEGKCTYLHTVPVHRGGEQHLLIFADICKLSSDSFRAPESTPDSRTIKKSDLGWIFSHDDIISFPSVSSSNSGHFHACVIYLFSRFLSFALRVRYICRSVKAVFEPRSSPWIWFPGSIENDRLELSLLKPRASRIECEICPL